jgi:hypothetical protein
MKKIILAIVLLLATLCTYNSNCQTIGINEFITSNKNIVTDPSGDYDDAIELINLTNDTINLLGYYLSDDTNFITKWPFPDTFILPNAFLVVWCDDEITQPGLHANFRLSTNGEAIILVSPLLTILERIVYPDQSSNVSFGKYPDGNGPMRYMYPTIGYGNLSVGVKNSESSINNLMVFPNPANGKITILSNENKCVLYDTNFRLLESIDLTISNTINTTNLKRGLYWLKVKNNVQKLIVQ